MSYERNPYESSKYGAEATTWEGYGMPASQAAEDERTAFIRRTYLHLLGAVVAFVLIEAAIFMLVPRESLDQVVLTMFGGRWSWLIVLGAFMGVSWLARSWASSDTSVGMQYAGLALYVVAQAVIFLPLLVIAVFYSGQPSLLPAAGALTLFIFAGLTAVMFFTKADMSFLGKYLMFGGIAAMGLIALGIFFQFSLGFWFAAAMVVLCSGYILYDTSNVIHHYRTDQHVAAALALFASVALLLWYIIQILMTLNRR